MDSVMEPLSLKKFRIFRKGLVQKPEIRLGQMLLPRRTFTDASRHLSSFPLSELSITDSFS